MEAGLMNDLASDDIERFKIFNLLAPYYMSIGMPLDEFWNGEPHLVETYLQCEVFRIRRRQRELWREGIYINRAIASAMSKDNKYFDEPLPATVEDSEIYKAKEEEKNRRTLIAMFTKGK